MELLPITLAAGETKRFEKAGRYLEIIDATAAIDVFLYDSAGGRGDEARNALSGLYLEVPFAAMEIYSATAQTITLLLTDGRGGSRRQPGIVSVTNKIGAGVTQKEGTGGPLLPTGMLAFEVVAPASNPRGLLVRRAVVNATAGGGGTSEVRLIAAPVVPASTVPVNAYNMAAAAGAAGVAVSDFHQDQNFQLPPNWGVWCATNHTVVAAAACGYSFTYEAL